MRQLKTDPHPCRPLPGFLKNYQGSDNAYYHDFICQQNWRAWLWAGAWALGMNLVLFTLMPNLLRQSFPPPVFDTLTPQINVIRIKKFDSPVEHKTPKPPVFEPKKPKPLPEAAHRRVLDPKLSLPFEINPKLPCGPATLEMPPMAQAALNDFGVPNIFSIGDLDQPLITLTRMPPIYPFSAKQRNIQGWVKVRFVVTAQGAVEDVTIISAQPPGVFDQSVMRCVSGWRFRPGTVGGAPVNTLAETIVKFELKQSESE